MRGVQGVVTPIASWRWRDAVFEDRFGQSPGSIKFAEPRSDTALRFYPSREQQWPIHLRHQVGGAKQQRHRAVSPLAEAVVTRPTSTLPRAQGLTRLIHPFLACAFGEQRRPTALAPLILVCAFGEQRRSTSPYALHSCFRPCARLGKLPPLNADQRYDAYS